MTCNFSALKNQTRRLVATSTSRLSAVVPLILLASIQAAGQNVVTDWNAIGITQARASTASGASSAGGGNVYIAYEALAVYNAVVAIDGKYQPYKYSVSAPARSFGGRGCRGGCLPGSRVSAA